MFFTSASCCVDCKIAKERHTVDIIKVVNLYTLLNVASDPILSIVKYESKGIQKHVEVQKVGDIRFTFLRVCKYYFYKESHFLHKLLQDLCIIICHIDITDEAWTASTNHHPFCFCFLCTFYILQYSYLYL